MKQKPLLIALAAIGSAALAYTGASWWAGKQAEITLAKQHQLVADLPYFVVKSRQYTRGIFSSQERTTIALSPNLIKPYHILMLEGLGKIKPEMTYTQTIKHGPLPLLLSGNFSPFKAVVTTDIEFTAETQAFLKKFFGEQKPLQIENRIRFDDDGVVLVKIPSFNHEEALSKVKAVWQGMDASISYGGDFNSIAISAVAPGLHFEANDKVTLDVKELRFESSNTRGAAGIMLGEGKMTLASAAFTQLEKDHPMDVKMDGLSYQVRTSAEGEFINSGGDIDLKTLALNGKNYGPAALSVSANHLHGPTLFKLSKAMAQVQREVADPAEQAGKMLKVFRNEGLPLLRNDPSLAIKRLSVKLPEGEVSLQAALSLKGFEDKDLDNPIKLLEKLQAKADLKVPKQVVETVVLWKARGAIAIDTEEGEQPDTEELDNLARNLMESNIRKLTEQNLIRADGDMLSSSAQWLGGSLTVNGTPIPLPWQMGLPAAAATVPPAEPAN
ncbi:YdgA family protein [Chitinimonas arctica]|uniref:YdgA family protein n=1 Tax=Chitinimonas arctica TaxID=2594795 RepID=UPI0015D399D7|nr:YdgA family protein [Chitinimonas arctica]